jgi:hypothetical protein
MSRSVRNHVPPSLEQRVRERCKEEGIPELHPRRTPEDWERVKQILEEEVLKLKEESSRPRSS